MSGQRSALSGKWRYFLRLFLDGQLRKASSRLSPYFLYVWAGSQGRGHGVLTFFLGNALLLPGASLGDAHLLLAVTVPAAPVTGAVLHLHHVVGVPVLVHLGGQFAVHTTLLIHHEPVHVHPGGESEHPAPGPVLLPGTQLLNSPASLTSPASPRHLMVTSVVFGIITILTKNVLTLSPMRPADDVSDWSVKFHLKHTAEGISVRCSVHFCTVCTIHTAS